MYEQEHGEHEHRTRIWFIRGHVNYYKFAHNCPTLLVAMGLPLEVVDSEVTERFCLIIYS